jgi:hypothetical protein
MSSSVFNDFSVRFLSISSDSGVDLPDPVVVIFSKYYSNNSFPIHKNSYINFVGPLSTLNKSMHTMGLWFDDGINQLESGDSNAEGLKSLINAQLKMLIKLSDKDLQHYGVDQVSFTSCSTKLLEKHFGGGSSIQFKGTQRNGLANPRINIKSITEFDKICQLSIDLLTASPDNEKFWFYLPQVV